MSESGSAAIRIGDDVTVDESAVEARKEAIIDILRQAANFNTDESTIRYALDKLEGAGRVSHNASLVDCDVMMGVDEEE